MSRHWSPIRRSFTRGLAAFFATVAVLRMGPATAAPGDIFSQPAPIIGADPPKAADVKDGDVSVATQTGAMNYSFPIAVPPGRNGMAPQLSLSYSSQAAIYGTVAAGWSISGIHLISEDTSRGRLRTHSPQYESVEADPKADDRFVSSMAGGRPLVKVDEPAPSDVYATYRAQNDATFARYQRMAPGAGYRWRVYTTDGTTYYFGDTSNGGPLSACAGTVSDGYAPITKTVDKFGNQITFSYASLTANDCHLSAISWGKNENAYLEDFARVAFEWKTAPSCGGIPVGSQLDYRTGTQILNGANVLTGIRATAFEPGTPGTPIHTRLLSLSYDDNVDDCTRNHAPVRLLAAIQEKAWGIDSPLVSLPPVTFEYGRPEVNLSAYLPQSWPWGDPNLAWGYRKGNGDWPTIEAMLVDLDGDGLQDRVLNAANPNDGTCGFDWRRNRGPKADGTMNMFGGTSLSPTPLPRLRWQGPNEYAIGNPSPPPIGGLTPHLQDEGCSLNHQVSIYRNVNASNPAPCHDGSGCTTSSNPDAPANGLFCYPFGLECAAPNTASGQVKTYLAYRWLDADGDGLTDIVAAVHGNIRAYDIVHGTLAGHVDDPAPFGAWPACPAEMDRCKAIDETCLANAISTVGPLCSINWQAVNACIDAAPAAACNDIIKDDGIIYAPPGGGGGGGAPQRLDPYTRCEGLYPWIIYKNQGDATFGAATIKYSPVPLESESGDSALAGPGYSSQYHGVVDVDGDGLLDAVINERGADTGWQVWLGDGTGGFEPRRYWVPTRPAPHDFISGIGTVDGASAKSTEGLFDINGDGVSEHWMATGTAPSFNANLAYHNGAHHVTFNYGNGCTGELNTPASVKTGADTTFTAIVENGTIMSGDGRSTSRMLDVDADGRVDVVQTQPGALANVFLNFGGQFATASSLYLGSPLGADRNVRVNDANVSPPKSWELRSDVIDIDGNGIPDSLGYLSSSGGLQRYVDPRNGAPPRLLVKVHNGQGAHTSISYASMHEEEVVKQAPAETWFDGRPKATPTTQWVVKSVRVVDDFALTDATTTHVYKNPRHGADDAGRYAFRGFEEVTTTAPSGSRTANRYSYNPDWSGRLAETLVYPAAGETTVTDEVRTIERTTWDYRQLFNKAITTYHAVASERFTCANGQTEAACTATSGGQVASPGYTRTTRTLTALASNTDSAFGPTLWQETSSLLQSGTVDADGDRRTTSEFRVDASPATYRVVTATVLQETRESGAFTTYARSQQEWDPTFRVPLTSETWFDADDSHRAVTRFDYDMTTGNVTARQKPEQNAGPKTSYEYDDRKLFVRTEVNELGHQLDFLYEYGTGTKLQTDGPNTRTCSSCPAPDPLKPEKEQSKIRVDGLGRTIERWDSYADDGSVYTLYQVERTSFFDAVTQTTPASMTHEVRQSTSATSAWTKETTEQDGHGRPLKKTAYVFGTAPNDHVTKFEYRNDGTLKAVSVPDPSQNNTTLVEYTYTFDSLGRATSIRRPDAAAPGQSGVDIAYDGATKTTSEVVGTAGGQVAVTRTVSDKFGRLRQVHELISSGPDTWATTTYSYGPDDVVSRIVDPEGVTTDLVHDFGGRRTEIRRHGRTWKYGYDRNGNMVSVQVPGSPGPARDLDFTTTTAYDDLDRPVSKVIGQRDLTAPDQELFASRTEAFTWDTGGNMVGALRTWRTYRPGATSNQPTITRDTRTNAQGLRTRTGHSFSDLAGFTGNRATYTNHTLFGAVSQTRYYDSIESVDPANIDDYTLSTIVYDARNLPKHVVFQNGNSSDPPRTLAAQTRNVAGLVTKRRTNATGAMAFVESNWSYDKLGRVTSQAVVKDPAPAEVVRQDLQYFGNDDPSSLTHHLGTDAKQFNFVYDRRHQLRGVTTDVPGYFAAEYEFGTAGRFVRAKEEQTISPLPPGSEVRSRDVAYVYGNADPEQVTALVSNVTGTTYASYAYDDAGNMTARCYGGDVASCSGEKTEYVYDGKDQLRRATKIGSGSVSGIEEYWYDADGHRAAIVKRDGSGAKTGMVWFINDVEAHYDATGTESKIHSHLSLGTPVARVTRTSSGFDIEYQFHGLANSTIAALGDDGVSNAKFIYTAFGTVVEGDDAGAAEHRRLHNDKYVDALTSLSYYGRRYLDRDLLMWTQADPLYRLVPERATAAPRKANLYTNVLNNPIRYLDPDGLEVGADALRLGAGLAVAGPDPATKMLGIGLLAVGGGAIIIAAASSGPTIPEIVEQWKSSQPPPPQPHLDVRAAAAAIISATLSSTGRKDPDTGEPDDISDGVPDFVPDERRPRDTGKVKPLPPQPAAPLPKARIPRWYDRFWGLGPEAAHNAGESQQTESTNGGSTQNKPADADGDGKVSDQEESSWMRSVQ